MLPVESAQAFGSIVEDIWTTILGLPVTPSSHPECVASDQPHMVGLISITGAWNGTIAVNCPLDLAQKMASSMFGGEPSEATRDMAMDSLGEITNMIGGNFKGLVPGPSQLSLPSVIEGSNMRLEVPGAERLDQVHFECGESSFCVQLVIRRREENILPS
jgi:chemotaxis protein CheX